jgi:hypothetical protein
MTALVALPTGPLAGIYKDSVCFTPPFQGFTFPVEYYQRTQYKPVALAVLGADLVVLTDGAPCIMSGASPEQIQQINIQSIQPCTDKRAVAYMDGAIIYACPDGIAAIDGPGPVRIISSEILTRDQWRAYGLSNMVFHVHEGLLYVSTTNYGVLCFDFTTATMHQVSVLTVGGVVKAFYYDVVTDRLGVIRMGETSLRWFQDAGAVSTSSTWLSKLYQMGTRPTPRWVFIKTLQALDTVRLRFYDSTGYITLLTATVATNKPVRLPVIRSMNVRYQLMPLQGRPITGCWFADSPGEFDGL